MKKKILLKSGILLLSIISIIVLSNFLKSKLLNNQEKILNSNDVQLLIIPEYEEYYINQDIWIKFILINNSSEIYYLKSPLQVTGITFNIVYPSTGEKRILPNDHTLINDSVQLGVGESYEKVISLNMIMPKLTTNDAKEYGVYKIRTSYQNINSNEIITNIFPPKGVDKELYDLTYEGLFTKDLPESEKLLKLEAFLEMYPESRYTPQLYNLLLLRTVSLENHDRWIKNVNEFFKHNHDTYGSKFILRSYSVYLGEYLKLDSIRANAKIKELSSQYPNSKLDYLIRQKEKESIMQR